MTTSSPIRNFLSSPWRAFSSAVVKAAANNWFLRGDDSPAGSAKTHLSNPYAESSWVFAALNLIADPIASARLALYQSEGGEPLDDATVAAFWKEPARSAHEPMGLDMLITLSVACRGVYGRVFWILDDSWLMQSPAGYLPIIVASERQLSAVTDGRDLVGWKYNSGSTMRTFLKEQVINLRLANPADPDSLEGVPPWSSASTAAETATAGSKYAKRVMDQNGDRGMIINVKGGAPSPEQRTQLLQELRERRRAVERGDFRDSVFGGDIEVTSPNLSAISADFAGQLTLTREEIFIAYGVPASMTTKAASYSVGAASDWYRLITGPCMKEARAIAGAVARVTDYLTGNRSLAAEIARGVRPGPRCHAEFDFSQHPVMAEVRVDRVKSLESLTKIGVPVSISNEFLALGLPEYPGMDERLLPMGLMPVTDTASLTQSHEGTKKPGEDLETLVRQWSARRAGLSEQAKAKARLELWKKIDSARNADRARVKKVVTKHLMAARKETLDNLKEAFRVKSYPGFTEAEIRAGVIEIAFNLGRWAKGMLDEIGSVLGGIWGKAGKQAGEEIGMPEDPDPDSGSGDTGKPGDFDPMTEPDPRVIEFLNTRRNLIKGVTDEMYKELVASLEEGLQKGETLDELSARVRALFNDFSKARAETIARTETGAAYESARWRTFKDAGITKKGWLSGGEDGVTRATHQAADGQSRGIDDFFEVGEARLLHPHDQLHGADHPEELINCRCVLTAEA